MAGHRCLRWATSATNQQKEASHFAKGGSAEAMLSNWVSYGSYDFV